MAVIEMQKEPRSIKTMLFIAALLVGFLALAAAIYWLIKPASPRQITLSGEHAKNAKSTYTPPAATLPTVPPVPLAQDPGPTLINLELKQVTPRQAIAEIATKAKVDLNLANIAQEGFLASLTAQRFDVSYKNETFWSAIIDLCKKGNLTPYADWNSPNRIAFQQTSASRSIGPTVAVGSSLVVLESVTSTFNANLTGPRPPNRDLRVGLQLYVEPKLAPYRISSVANLETAVDEKGTDLIRPRQQWDDRNNGGGPQNNWTRDVQCLLRFPDNAGDRIARLKGYCTVAVAGPPKTEKITEPLAKKNHDVKIDNVLVRLLEIRQNGNEYVVRMAGDVNSPVFKDYERMQNIAKLIDTNGKEFNRSGGSYGGGRGNAFEFSVDFSGPGMSEPKELHITLPSGLKELRVPFEFTDLPLPH
jgi:hypothetical protein